MAVAACGVTGARSRCPWMSPKEDPAGIGGPVSTGAGFSPSMSAKIKSAAKKLPAWKPTFRKEASSTPGLVPGTK